MDTNAVLDAQAPESFNTENDSPLVAGFALAMAAALLLGSIAVVTADVFGWYDFPAGSARMANALASPNFAESWASPSLGEALVKTTRITRPQK